MGWPDGWEELGFWRAGIGSASMDLSLLVISPSNRLVCCMIVLGYLLLSSDKGFLLSETAFLPNKNDTNPTPCSSSCCRGQSGADVLRDSSFEVIVLLWLLIFEVQNWENKPNGIA